MADEVDERSAWQRLGAALGPRPTTARVVGALLLGLLGFALVVQARSTQEAGLAALRQSDLVRILDDTAERSARLRAEAAELAETRRQLAGGTDSSRAAIEEARERAAVLGILAGTAPAVGPGVVVTVPDPQGAVQPDLLLDAVQELRDAGAEAIQIGPVRVVAATAFVSGEDGTGVVVDGVRLTPPYRLQVIGDPRTLSSALEIPGGINETLRRRGSDPVVEEREEVAITALRAAPTPQYARPAPEAAGSAGG